LGVVFTNGTSSSFFSFSTLAFFSPEGADRVFADLAANFASFSNRLASFLAGETEKDFSWAGQTKCLTDLSS
jgi:hypothetical protein